MHLLECIYLQSTGNFHEDIMCLAVHTVGGCLLCGWQTPRLNSVTDSPCVNSNSTVWISTPDTSYMHVKCTLFLLLQPQECHSWLNCGYFINMACKRCIYIWCFWRTWHDQPRQCQLCAIISGFLWSMNALYLWHHGYSYKYSHRSSSWSEKYHSCCCCCWDISLCKLTIHKLGHSNCSAAVQRQLLDPWRNKLFEWEKM